MAEENKPSLPADYVSIAVLRERWLERQKIKKQQEEEEARRREMEGEEGWEDEKKGIVDICEKGEGKKVVEKRGRNVGLYEGRGIGYDYVDGMKMSGGGGGVGGSRGFRDKRMEKLGHGGYGGDRRRFGRIEVGDKVVEGYGGDRRRFGGIKERTEVGDKVVEEDYGGDRRRFEGRRERIELGDKVGEGYGGDRRRFRGGLWVGKGNVVEDEGLEGFGNMGIGQGEDFGGEYGEFGRGLGVGKGRNEVEMRGGVEGKRLEGLKGYGNRRVDEGVDFGNLEIGGGRKGSGKYGGGRERGGFGKGESGDVKRYVVDVREGNVVDVKLLEDLGERWVNEVEIGGGFRGLGGTRAIEEVEIGTKFKDFLRNDSRRGSGKYGRDRGRFVEVLGFGKGENVVEKKRNVVDVREENVVDGKMLEVTEGYGGRRMNEAVDIGKEFGDLKIDDGGRRGKFRYGGVHRGFRPREEKISVAVRKEDEAEKPIAVAMRRENEVEKRKVNVKGKNDIEKQIPVAMRDKTEVKKQNLVDVKMAESSKGFGHWRGNEAIGRKFGGLSNHGWRKGHGNYGRGRGRFGSWKNKLEESGMMWVKKTDAQAPAETADVE